MTSNERNYKKDILESGDWSTLAVILQTNVRTLKASKPEKDNPVWQIMKDRELLLIRLADVLDIESFRQQIMGEAEDEN